MEKLTQKEMVLNYIESFGGEWIRSCNLRARKTIFGWIGSNGDRRARDLALEGKVNRSQKLINGHLEAIYWSKHEINLQP